MNSKRITIIIVIAVLLIVAGLVWYYFYSTKLAPTPQSSAGPSFSSVPHPSGTANTPPPGSGTPLVTG